MDAGKKGENAKVMIMSLETSPPSPLEEVAVRSTALLVDKDPDAIHSSQLTANELIS